MEVLGLLVVAYAACSVILTCALLTGVGACRRGHHRVAPVLLSAVFFPLTWAVWYLYDTRPFDIAGRRVA